ncbi:MAG: hypothetical protein ABIJ46_04125 [bacterium]
MGKWKIVVPVLIVAVVGLIAWLQLSGGVEPQVVPEVEDQVEVSGGAPSTQPAITGSEGLDVQADALVETMVGEYAESVSAVGDGSDLVDAETGGEADSDIFNVDYYAE